MRRLDSPEMKIAKTFGAKLFDSVFGSEIRACFRSSSEEAGRRDVGLRLRLRLDTPELADLPGNTFTIQTLNRFLALSVHTPLVRYLELPEHIKPLTVEPPLRMLVMISNPSDYSELDVEQEWTILNGTLGSLKRGRIGRTSPNSYAGSIAKPITEERIPHLSLHWSRHLR